MSKPKNWPPSLPYFKAPQHGQDMTPAQLQYLRTKPTSQSQLPDNNSNNNNNNNNSYSNDDDLTPIIPASSPATQTPCPRVKILPITNPQHPAHGQFGLFAATNILPGELIVAYLGRLHGRGTTSAESDYDIWLEREVDVAVDAARGGNEARFVNDYRGVPGSCEREREARRPNARFGNGFCERWGEVCVGVWAVGGGKGGASSSSSSSGGAAGGGGKKKKRGGDGGIRKGEEILVSYGKGFWEERMRESGDGGDGEEDGVNAGGDTNDGY